MNGCSRAPISSSDGRFPRFRRRADFSPNELVDPGITEDRYVKWVQIIPTAHCCVHHSHVYRRRRGADREGLGPDGLEHANEVDI